MMGWGEATTPHPKGGIVVEVAAAEHLAAVTAERDHLKAEVWRLRGRLEESTGKCLKCGDWISGGPSQLACPNCDQAYASRLP